VKPSAKTPVSCYVIWHTSRNGVITHVGNPASRGGKLKSEFMTLKDTQSSFFFFFFFHGQRENALENVFLPKSARVKRKIVQN
jgi:hypothetical protein